MKWLRWLAWRIVPHRLRARIFDGEMPFWPGEIVEASAQEGWGDKFHDYPDKRMSVTALVVGCERNGAGWTVLLLPHKPTAREWERVWWYWMRESRAMPLDAQHVRHFNIVDRLAGLA